MQQGIVREPGGNKLASAEPHGARLFRIGQQTVDRLCQRVRISGRTGILVPPGDTDALSKAIDRILNTPDEARAKGLRGRELVSVRFTDAVLLNGWQDLIRGTK